MNKTSQNTDFEQIVLEFQEKVRNTCYRYVNNAEDADDIAQEVFIQVYESISHFREDSQLSTWIYRISVNKSLDFIRKKKRKKRFAQLTSLFKSDEDDQAVEIPDYDTPEKELEDKERNEVLNEAISMLPENQKTAVILSRYEGFSNKEIAKIMDLSLPSVEALMHRAKKGLHKKLYNYFENNI